jgi:hypothetical protein
MASIYGLSPGAGPEVALTYTIYFCCALTAYIPSVLYIAKLVREKKLKVPEVSFPASNIHDFSHAVRILR